MFGKLWQWLGLADIEEAGETTEPVKAIFTKPAETAEKERPVFKFEETRKVPETSYEAVMNSGVNIAVIQPQHFEDSQRAVDCIRNNHQVVLDCSASTPDVSRRVIDFLSGAVYAVNGQARPVGNGVFLFVPENTDVK